VTCPVCDLEKDKLTPIQAFVFGLGMGAEFGTHRTGDMMCVRHVEETTVAMLEHTHRLREDLPQ